MAAEKASRPAGSALARDGTAAEDSPFRRRWSWRTRMGVVLAGRAIALVLRLLYATLRVQWADPAGVIPALRRGEGAIFAFWHDGLVLVPLLPLRAYPGLRLAVMLSWHRDAEIAAQAVARFGVRAVRGSSTRGWLGGLRGLLAAHERGETIVVVPDGPRGPRHQAKDGVVQLARATGLPVVAVGAAARGARRLGSWDRMQIPRPFTRVAYVLSAPVRLARDEPTAAGVARVQAALDEAARAAGAAAGGG